MEKYEIKVAGKKVAEFTRQHIMDACADDMFQLRREKGVSVTNLTGWNLVDFSDACEGDEKVIKKYNLMQEQYKKRFGF